MELKLQFFGHLRQRADSLEKTLVLGKIEGGKRRGRQRVRCLDGISDSMGMSLSRSRRWWRTGKPDVLQSMGSLRVRHDLATEHMLLSSRIVHGPDASGGHLENLSLRSLMGVCVQFCSLSETLWKCSSHIRSKSAIFHFSVFFLRLVFQIRVHLQKELLFVVQSLSRVWLCSSMDYSPPGSSVHGINPARILEWVVISFSRGSSWPKDQTQVSCVGRQILYRWATRV